MLPGDLFLTQIDGAVGVVIRCGQAFAGDFSRYIHAGIILDNDEVISAQPSGARVDPLASIIDKRPLAIMPVPPTAQDRRGRIVEFARSLEGHRYGFEAYLSIALARLGIKPGWLQNLMASERGLICSAFADAVWLDAGIHLFDDGRLLGEVTPGDLAHVGWTYHVGTGPFVEPGL